MLEDSFYFTLAADCLSLPLLISLAKLKLDSLLRHEMDAAFCFNFQQEFRQE